MKAIIIENVMYIPLVEIGLIIKITKENENEEEKLEIIEGLEFTVCDMFKKDFKIVDSTEEYNRLKHKITTMVRKYCGFDD